jgi:hypothetical protein
MRKILLLFLFLFFGCDDKDNTFEPNYLGTYSITFTTAVGGTLPVQIIDNFSSRENISENDYYYPEIIYGRVTSIENEIIGSGIYIDILGNQQSYNYPISSTVTFEYDPRMFEDEELKLKVANAYNMVTAEVTSSEIIRYEFTGRALRIDFYEIINYSCPDGNSPSGASMSMIPRTPGSANDTCCYEGNNRMSIYAYYNCST